MGLLSGTGLDWKYWIQSFCESNPALISRVAQSEVIYYTSH